MSQESHRRIGELFSAACELDASEREAFLARECDDEALRAEVLELLDRDARHDPRLSTADGQRGQLIDAALNDAAAERPGARPDRIGPYRLLEKIGEGGMGEVWAADQQEPVRRRVALKLIKRGMDSASVVARFEAERQALARMSHAAIAQVFDGGTAPDGRPYFVMEYVAGDAITDHCDRLRRSTRERIELFLQVCEGVQHAHQKGLVHRDLKPGNLLVTQQDGRELPKIIDFGIARATTGRLVDRTLHTMAGQIIGTLDYMSPEQADPTHADIDTRSDIYSLGVVLYQLLSGLLPFEHASVAEGRFSDMQRAIREQQAPTPSTRLRRATDTASSIAPRHGTDERTLARQLSGDLDWICLKALEKDPDRRYASASELAQDLRRHLADEPVLARRPSAVNRAIKFVRRNRVGVAAGVIAAAGAIAGVFGMFSGRLIERTLQPVADEYDARVLLGLADETLWPPHPANIPALEAWLGQARLLLERLPAHRLRLEGAREDSTRALLATLIGRLEQLEDLSGGSPTDGVTPAYGWSVPRRLAFARDLEAGFAPGGAHDAEWADALPAIAHALADRDADGVLEPVYADLELGPQLGLLPLGPDPDSGFWEFWHMATGDRPRRGPDGRLVLTETTGVVLVLIPSGSYRMGSPDAWMSNARPVHEVQLSAYFLSKYEMTQAQWKGLTGSNPSLFGPDGQWNRAWLVSGEPPSLQHPVEQVPWVDAQAWLERAGLALPTEAQWEYGARGGKDEPTDHWWTGSTKASLQGAANIADAYRKTQIAGSAEADFDDGCAMHWAVGEHRANPYGLHDVVGNVLEWCLDGYVEDFYAESPSKDPVAPWHGRGGRHVCRGGNFRTSASGSRSASRSYMPSSHAGDGLGVRPARPITYE